MTESNFVDFVKIYCRSGKGGRGSAHMRRAKYMPKGGPDGGNGGHGGNIYVRGNRNYWTLLHLRYERQVFAGHGENGSKALRTGKDGEDKYIEVPLGTVVYNAETGDFICEITCDKQVELLLEGGRGGLGNWNFRTSTNQAPRYAQPGEPMQEMEVAMELKLLADVGLVGFPNAGKSTLMNVMTSARPKIADYPFTTLEPSLGIVEYRDNQSFVMADIPGIIEGANEGKGLGLRFLRHIERNSLLLFMVPCVADNLIYNDNEVPIVEQKDKSTEKAGEWIAKEYNILLNELALYNPQLLDKRRVLAVTKCDLINKESIDELSESLPDIPHVFISSITKFGIKELKDLLWKELNNESNKMQAISPKHKLYNNRKEENAIDNVNELSNYEYEEKKER